MFDGFVDRHQRRSRDILAHVKASQVPFGFSNSTRLRDPWVSLTTEECLEHTRKLKELPDKFKPGTVASPFSSIFQPFSQRVADFVPSELDLILMFYFGEFGRRSTPFSLLSICAWFQDDPLFNTRNFHNKFSPVGSWI